MQETDNNELVISPVYPHKTIAERFKGYNDEYRGEVIDWGEDIGDEIY